MGRNMFLLQELCGEFRIRCIMLIVEILNCLNATEPLFIC